ncbi:hypothetical protein [Streptomyces albogriseolus]|uniref:hypothetical protein n=1 Tax=Streptomyces albogriseolus TaxID=1887 RepID=UPI0033A4CECF
MKKDAEVSARFDGCGRVEIVLRGLRVARARSVEAIAHETGCALNSREVRGKNVLRLRFVRDDNPLAGRRAEETQARITAGGPLPLPGGARRPSPPPPPQPLPPHLRADGQHGR